MFIFCWSELQILSFIYIPNCNRCPLPLKLMTFVLSVLKSYMFCPLNLTQLIFMVKSNHVQSTWGRLVILLI
ncbi:hypothetical protein Hanom_Chr16g01427001 [Helianthus anomalus]